MHKPSHFVLVKRLLLLFSLCLSFHGARADYKKATEGRDVVMNKLYPKATRFELGLPQVGLIMNQSYVNTLLLGVDGTYFLSETLGFSLSFSKGINQDKSERTCIENFFYDPYNEVGIACGDRSNIPVPDKNNDDQFPRYGPAYVPIRELQQTLLANVVWTPVYGKQLIYFGATSYFDLFIELGVGMAGSKYYPKQEILKNGNFPRGDYSDPKKDTNSAEATTRNNKIGVIPADTEYYGVAGRPPVQDELNPTLNLGLGQKFHFGKFFHFKVYIRNLTLLGTGQGFENLFALYTGVGVRF